MTATAATAAPTATTGSITATSPPPAASAVLTFALRGVLKIKHVPEQLMDATIFPILFTLMFTYVFGGAIAGAPADYLDYALPGLLTQTVVFITMYTAMSINTDLSTGVADRLRSLPVWRPAYLTGALLADMLRYAVATSMVVGVATLIGYRAPGGVTGLVAAATLLLAFCFALSWMWLIVGLKVRTPSAVMGVAVTVLFPLTFVSSAFSPPETMPSWLEAFVDVNPLTLVVEACRGLVDGDPSLGQISLVLVVSVGLTTVFAPIALRLYNLRS